MYDFHQRERGIFIEGNIVSLGGSVITHVLTQAQIKFRQELDNARSGNVNAQINVGWRYENGDGTEKNFSEAARWYAEAAKKGNAMAMNNLGELYERGTGVKQNYSEARKLYRQAADKGNQYGMWNLGLMSENGIGTEKNLNEAIEWYYKAADNKHDSARNRLKALAEGGNAYAQNMLGHFYYFNVTSRNYKEAREWYIKAAKEKNADWGNYSSPQYMLGLIYENGYVPPKDLDLAAKYYKPLADQGDRRAAFRLHKVYEAKNDNKYLLDSVRYLKQARDSGHQEAATEYDKQRKALLDTMQKINRIKAEAAKGNKNAKQALAKFNAEIDSQIGMETFNAMLSEFGFTSSAQSSPSSRKPAKRR